MYVVSSVLPWLFKAMYEVEPCHRDICPDFCVVLFCNFECLNFIILCLVPSELEICVDLTKILVIS